jgi:ParB/RepB/Spo0J family partition protein
MLIETHKLHADKRNPNRCSPDTMATIANSIQLLGHYQPLIVRPDPDRLGEYIIVDGHHRHRILKERGDTQVHCEVWKMSDKKARLALLTMNRLRGMDDYRARSELIESLTQDFTLDELSKLLPESVTEMQDMLAMLRLDEEQLEQEIQALRQAEAESLPIPYAFMVAASEAPTVEAALARFPGTDQSTRFLALCRQAVAVTDGT